MHSTPAFRVLETTTYNLSGRAETTLVLNEHSGAVFCSGFLLTPTRLIMVREALGSLSPLTNPTKINSQVLTTVVHKPPCIVSCRKIPNQELEKPGELYNHLSAKDIWIIFKF